MNFRNKVFLTLSLTLSMLLLAIFIIPGALAENSCVDCHKNLPVYNETGNNSILHKLADYNYEQWTQSKHALLGVTCDKCHGGTASSNDKEIAHIGVNRSSNVKSNVYYENVPKTCGKCHTEEFKNFTSSEHYLNLEANKQAPTCSTCHKPHEFNVLNITEFHDLCSNCHNSEMNVAPRDAPDKAAAALGNSNKLKSEIKLADDAIKQAKAKGRDVSSAQDDLKKAESIRDSLPARWHSFDLSSFDNLINDGIDAAQKSQKEAEVQQTTGATPSTPGFGIILSMIGFTIIYASQRYFRRK